MDARFKHASAELIGKMRAASRSPTLRRIALAVAVVVFAGGLYFALERVDLTFSDIRWTPLLWLVLLGVPVTILLNTVEMELSAAVVGFRFGFRKALVLTIFASAANMLPLPGAAMVRVGGLASAGASLRASGAATLAIALLWLGVAFCYSGLFLLALRPAIGGAALALGAGAVVAGIGWTRYLNGGWRTGVQIAALKLAMVLLSVIRIQLCLAAIGVTAGFAQVSVFAVSGVLGSAVSIVPAGLGVRELVSAAAAPLVGLQASAAFVATAIDRIAAMSLLLIVTAALSLADIKPQRVPR